MAQHEAKPIMLRVLAHAKSLATRAGAEIRKICLSGKLDVVDKGQGLLDYQTEADRLAQRMIVANLKRRFPKCYIVGEEQLEEDTAADERLLIDEFDEEILNNVKLPDHLVNIPDESITIWVDPLDGTTEFVKGLLEHVTVLIGISHNNHATAGVIHQPFYGYGMSTVKDEGSDSLDRISQLKGRTIWGLAGVGCFGLDTSAEDRRAKLPKDKLIVTTTASHSNKNVEESIASLKPDQVLKVGGAGHKVILVLEGKAHAFVFTSYGCKYWDTAAPEALLRAAGGLLTDSLGKDIDYEFNDCYQYQNLLGVVATIDANQHKRIIDGIPEEVKSRLQEGKKKFASTSS